MKKISKLLAIFLLVNVVIFNLAFAEPLEENVESEEAIVQVEEKKEESSSTPIAIDKVDVNTEKVEEAIVNVADKGESLAYTIVEQISDKSLPICTILILWGAVLYFILGIRNLYKKRQGLLLMWGAFTFVVMAKIINFAFWFAFVR